MTLHGAKIEWIGLRAWRGAMQRAPGLIKLNALRALPGIGEGLIDAGQGWIRGRRTSLKTRRRRDKGSVLGTFSGRLGRSIKVTKLKTTRSGFTLEVGPTGKAEEYAFLHEFGAGPYRMRSFMGRALIDEEQNIYRLLGRKIFLRVG